MVAPVGLPVTGAGLPYVLVVTVISLVATIPVNATFTFVTPKSGFNTGITITVTVAELLHPVVVTVPVTIYIVVDIGEAVTDEVIVAESPVFGVQE